jgi:hypothetical protein
MITKPAIHAKMMTPATMIAVTVTLSVPERLGTFSLMDPPPFTLFWQTVSKTRTVFFSRNCSALADLDAFDVTLSAAKGLVLRANEILRFAQNDRLSSYSFLNIAQTSVLVNSKSYLRQVIVTKDPLDKSGVL